MIFRKRPKWNIARTASKTALVESGHRSAILCAATSTTTRASVGFDGLASRDELIKDSCHEVCDKKKGPRSDFQYMSNNLNTKLSTSTLFKAMSVNHTLNDCLYPTYSYFAVSLFGSSLTKHAA